MIRAEAISKSYGSLRAVTGVSFTVPSGKVLGLLGPNGAGKTTILRMLAGILTPSSGTVCIDDYDVSEARIGAQKKIGYLPENSPLYPAFKTLEYLRFSAGVYGMHGEDAAEAVERVAHACGVDGVGDRLIGQLSRGYRQRIGLAAALVHNPSVLVLDEPTNGLDPNQIDEFRSIVRSYAKTSAVVFSTHILQEVEAVCDEILVINRGSKVAYGSADEIRASLDGGATVRATTIEFPGEAARLALQRLGVARFERAESGECVMRVQLAADHSSEQIYAWSVEHGVPLRSLEQEAESLQTLFSRLTRPEQDGGRPR